MRTKGEIGGKGASFLGGPEAYRFCISLKNSLQRSTSLRAVGYLSRSMPARAGSVSVVVAVTVDIWVDRFERKRWQRCRN